MQQQNPDHPTKATGVEEGARPGETPSFSSNQIKHLTLALAQHVNNWAHMLLRHLYHSLLIWLALVPVYLLSDDLHPCRKPTEYVHFTCTMYTRQAHVCVVLQVGPF